MHARKLGIFNVTVTQRSDLTAAFSW